jgi:hypothetical protein
LIFAAAVFSFRRTVAFFRARYQIVSVEPHGDGAEAALPLIVGRSASVRRKFIEWRLSRRERSDLLLSSEAGAIGKSPCHCVGAV